MLSNDIDLTYLISPPVTNDGLNTLFAAAWSGHSPTDFSPVLNRSLAFVCAYHSSRLIGFVNLAWDGGIHAFVLDTTFIPNINGAASGGGSFNKRRQWRRSATSNGCMLTSSRTYNPSTTSADSSQRMQD